jgi:sarcosine oxidase subunit gamma
MERVSVFERRSALGDAADSAGTGPIGNRAQLRIGEVRGWNLVQITAFTDTRSDLCKIFRREFDTELPTETGYVTRVGGRRLLKTGSDRYWIITAEEENLSRALQSAVGPDIGVVTPLSHSRSCFFIDGTDARRILSSGISLDLHPEVFGIDRFALTELHHTPVMLHRVAENCYNLFPLRTYAFWVWGWLSDAALPFTYTTGS